MMEVGARAGNNDTQFSTHNLPCFYRPKFKLTYQYSFTHLMQECAGRKFNITKYLWLNQSINTLLFITNDTHQVFTRLEKSLDLCTQSAK